MTSTRRPTDYPPAPSSADSNPTAQKKDGTISIQSQDITAKGSSGIDVKASKKATI